MGFPLPPPPPECGPRGNDQLFYLGARKLVEYKYGGVCHRMVPTPGTPWVCTTMCNLLKYDTLHPPHELVWHVAGAVVTAG